MPVSQLVSEPGLHSTRSLVQAEILKFLKYRFSLHQEQLQEQLEKHKPGRRQKAANQLFAVSAESPALTWHHMKSPYGQTHFPLHTT